MENSFPPIIFSEKIDIRASHLLYNPGLLFVCGGECEDITKSPKSVRDLVLRRITDTKPDILSRTIQAEDMQSWLGSGAFRDLVLFEKALAHLADKIVIFVESPGSVAELGAFSFMEEISSKLLVFISSRYRDSSSFITLGPLKKLLHSDSHCVKFYEWDTPHGQEKINADLRKAAGLEDSIITDIESALSKHRIKQQFSDSNIEHILLFICDLVSLFPALQMMEIRDICLMALIDIPKSDLNGYLYILTKSGLLEEANHGETYYVINSKYNHVTFLAYKFKDTTVMHDRSRIKVEMLDYLNKSSNPKDKKRLKIIMGANL